MARIIDKKNSEIQEKIGNDELWIEEVDEVMFQPSEIVPNVSRAYSVSSDLQRQIEGKLSEPLAKASFNKTPVSDLKIDC